MTALTQMPKMPVISNQFLQTPGGGGSGSSEIGGAQHPDPGIAMIMQMLQQPPPQQQAPVQQPAPQAPAPDATPQFYQEYARARPQWQKSMAPTPLPAPAPFLNPFMFNPFMAQMGMGMGGGYPSQGVGQHDAPFGGFSGMGGGYGGGGNSFGAYDPQPSNSPLGY